MKKTCYVAFLLRHDRDASKYSMQVDANHLDIVLSNPDFLLEICKLSGDITHMTYGPTEESAMKKLLDLGANDYQNEISRLQRASPARQFINVGSERTKITLER